MQELHIPVLFAERVYWNQELFVFSQLNLFRLKKNQY